MSLASAELRFRNLLRLRSGTSHFWRATPRPGIKDNCYAEGHEIIQSIDTDNLCKLILDNSDNKNLNPSWLNMWDRFAST
ncbi:hypothetical protein DL771_007988 [Monosporascus sp. 5C6A]|nr:hypothetical protein DL771_007988 [Monosporascus sp. 5C6A]